MNTQIVLFLVILGCILTDCQQKQPIDLSEIEYELDFKRLDSQMYRCAKALHEDTTMDIYTAYEQYLKSDREFYLQLLGINYSGEAGSMNASLMDSLVANNICTLLQDRSMYRLLDTIQMVFPENYDFKNRLSPPIKRLIYYFSIDSLEIPAFRTFANGYIPDGSMRTVDQLQVLPDYIGLGLHYFMGEHFPYYPVNVPQYIRKQFQPEYMDVVLVSALAEGMVAPVDPGSQPTLLDKIIQSGIKQYFVDQLLPETPDSLKLYYSSEQIAWADEYEAFLYKDVISHLYDIDFVVHRDYLGNKPYSTHISQEAPPRIGQYIGWKIVNAYTKRHPEITLPQLCGMTDYDRIFKEARYRPNP